MATCNRTPSTWPRRRSGPSVIQAEQARSRSGRHHPVVLRQSIRPDAKESAPCLNPAAGVNASISDMSRWVLAHMGHNPEVLSPIVLKTVHAKVTRNTPAQNHYGNREGVTDSHYGLGWRVFDYRGDKNFVHHGGGVKGFRSEVVFNPDLQIGMVVLTNTERLGGDIIFKFLDAYEDDKRGEKRFNAEAAQAAQPAKKKVKQK